MSNPGGHVKFWLERVKGYAVYVSSLMVVDLWVRSHGYGWLVVAPILIIIIVALYLFDRKYIYGGEAEAGLKNNPEWNALRGDVRELLKRK